MTLRADGLKNADTLRSDTPPRMSDPELESAVNNVEALRAGFKIEVHFGPGRTDRDKFKALVLILESGKHFHGGGDDQAYICLDHRVFEVGNTTPPSVLPAMRQKFNDRYLKGRTSGRTASVSVSGCGGVITSVDVHLGLAHCPHCLQVVNAATLTGQMPFFGSVRDLAELVEIFFVQLKSNADCYAKYDRVDIRYNACEKTHGLEKARQLRGLFIYPMANILRETANGSSVRSRLEAFFRA